MATTPTKDWTRLLGTTGNEYVFGLATGLEGSIYITGITQGSLNEQTNNGEYDAYLAKYGPDGSIVWTRLLGSSATDWGRAVTTGIDGSIYVFGRTKGQFGGQTHFSGGEYYEPFLAKYSPDGGMVWARLLGWQADSYAATTGLDGSIYVSGTTNGSVDGQTNNGAGASSDYVTNLINEASGRGFDVYLTKYSADGVKAWTRLLGTSEVEGVEAITTGLDGSIYVSGTTYGSLDGQTNKGGSDVFLAKYSPDGVKAWTRLLGNGGDDWSKGLTTGLDGSIYVSGTTDGSLDGQTNYGGNDAFLAKYSPDGVKAWTRLSGTSKYEAGHALTTGLDGSIYMGGFTYGSLDGQASSSGTDPFLTRYSPDGVTAWTRLLATKDTVDWESLYLTTGLDGAVYMSGRTLWPLDGQPHSDSAHNDKGGISLSGTPQAVGRVDGKYDVYLVKYSVNDTASTPALSTSNQSQTFSLDVIASLFGNVLLLKGLKESVSGETHTVEYNGEIFNYTDVDFFVTTVVRDGEFTSEFAQEIADAYPDVAGIKYSVAASIVGSALDEILIQVAGADGNYVG